MVVCPAVLSPHATSVPSDLRARVCAEPAATAMALVSPTGTVVCPELFKPHARTCVGTFTLTNTGGPKSGPALLVTTTW